MIQRELLENALDNLPYGIYIVDSLGNYIFANTVYVNMVKIPKDKLLAYNVYNLKKNKEINICITEKVCKLKKRIVMFQDVEIKGHEHYKQIVASSPILDMNGNVVCVIALCIPAENINYLYQEAIHNEVKSFIKLPPSEAHESNNIIAVSPVMKSIINLADTLAPLDSTVIILGESGTGKEVLARYIHEKSQRASKDMVIINCASLPESLLESELFGYEKGAFTGASAQGKKGLFEAANDSTLFLDEINSMPMNLQSKLLRALQENKIRRIGAKDTIDINVKIIAALNKDPMKAIEDEELRMDLYYRLSVLNITIPPLRERKDDISVLVNYFVAKYNELLEKNVRYISSDICQTFQTYDWPGNIREIEHIVAFGMSVIRPDQEKLEFSDLERKWIEITGKKKHKTELPAKDLKTMVEEYEKSVIEKVLEVSAHNITKASLILKIPRQTLQRKIKQYEL